MDPALPEPETTSWQTDPGAPGWVSLPDGRRQLPIYKSVNEEVRMEQWPPGLEVQFVLPENGEEFLVVRGLLTDTAADVVLDDSVYRTRTWVRNPASLAGKMVKRVSGPEGALVWFKTNHLNSPEVGI